MPPPPGRPSAHPTPFREQTLVEGVHDVRRRAASQRPAPEHQRLPVVESRPSTVVAAAVVWLMLAVAQTATALIVPGFGWTVVVVLAAGTAVLAVAMLCGVGPARPARSALPPVAFVGTVLSAAGTVALVSGLLFVMAVVLTSHPESREWFAR